MEEEIEEARRNCKALWNLNDRKLTSLPDEFFLLTALRVLNLANNGLSSLPPSISKLVNLQVLDVSVNQLEELPCEIGNLTQLTTLMVYNNRISLLPYSIGKLTSLRSLSLGYANWTAKLNSQMQPPYFLALRTEFLQEHYPFEPQSQQVLHSSRVP